MLRTLAVAAVIVSSMSSGARAEKAAPRRIAVAHVEPPPALTAERVVDKINTVYIAGIQRCFRKSLAVDPALRGNIALAFKVALDGSTIGSAGGVAEAVDGCVSSLLKTWRFSAPAKELDLKISLVLAPS